MGGLGDMERADFAALRILLVSEKNHAAQTLRAVLTLAGISRITGVEASPRAIELLTMDPYDAVFCAEDCAPVRGLSFPLAVRRLPHVLDPLMPVFVFQEGHDGVAERAFKEMARLSRGAWFRFDRNAASRLAGLLSSIAVYATGGLKALESRGRPEDLLMIEHLRTKR